MALRILVDPNDPDDVARAITRLLTGNDLSAQMGLRGRARVVNDFPWKKVGSRVLGILDAVLDEQRIARSYNS